MNRISKPSRSYRSAVRGEHAELTRSRILDATLRIMASGLATISIPAVAREAGVSVPTVYRHFATKAELLEATYPHVVRQTGLDEVPPPTSLDELRDGVRDAFARVEALDDLARAAIVSPAAEEARSISMPRRLALSRRLVADAAPSLPGTDRERLARVLTVLTTSSALRTWVAHLDASADDAADDVDWLVRAAIAGAGRQRP